MVAPPESQVDDVSLIAELSKLASAIAVEDDDFFKFRRVASMLMSILDRNSLAVTSDVDLSNVSFLAQVGTFSFLLGREKFLVWLDIGKSSIPSPISEDEELRFDDMDDLVVLLDEFEAAPDKFEEVWLQQEVKVDADGLESVILKPT